MSKLYIVSGANGSGKTTFSKKLTQELNIYFLNADEIAKEIDPHNTTGGEVAAGKIFFKRLQKLLKGNESFVLESTLSGKYLEKIISKAKENGYSIELIYIFLENPTVCIERIKERVLNGGHHVPDQAVIRRFYRSKNNFWNIYKNVSDRWFLIYNSELIFKEFCIGSKDNYTINDNSIFNDFMKDVEL
ncbi:zeta toxin family protein [Lentisphaera marina]|uniref:zeta toxin family protein n=1 Tax=Lentisphaera marina TaxID=1111041 RepID=UPI002365D285|nr:AAA family ATPase [Lentisphaera marina]MDD7984646.1 zeta toxin family protein [Lentisphaera marina]